MPKKKPTRGIHKLIQTNDDRFPVIFSALSDPSRFRIFKLLVECHGYCVSELAKKMNISVSAVSQHLKILELSGLASKERTAQTVCYKIKDNDPIVKSLIKILKK